MIKNDMRTRVISLREWKDLVAVPGDRSDHRFRRQSRIPVDCEARLVYAWRGGQRTCLVTVINASDQGLMLKAESELELETPVSVELMLEDEVVVVRGSVQHCTASLGCHKIGVELTF